MRIENWSITSVGGDYDPPECRHMQVQGNVYEHPLHSDGKYVRTSDVRAVNGREVTTKHSGVYTLGEPDPKYIEWCRQQGCHVPTLEEPIKV